MEEIQAEEMVVMVLFHGPHFIILEVQVVVLMVQVQVDTEETGHQDVVVEVEALE
jgi:hypothetical protein